jgi:outer membrane protein TolC
VQRKVLVALTGLAEPDLMKKLDTTDDQTALPALFSIAKLPAKTLRQRPDIWAAERDVLAARAEIHAADAARWPSLSLIGTLGKVRLATGDYQSDYTSWSFGPLQLALPILDGGRIAAGQAAARGRYDEAVATYKAKVRQAVQEVETALVQGAAAREKESDTRATVAGYRRQFEAVQALYQQGLASLPQLQEARRNLLAAETGLSQWRHDAQVAGVALYRALGGGWQPAKEGGP